MKKFGFVIGLRAADMFDDLLTLALDTEAMEGSASQTHYLHYKQDCKYSYLTQTKVQTRSRLVTLGIFPKL